MTGFGVAKTSPTYLEVSIRSVNGRFLEPRFHLPREFYSFESDLKKILEKYFRRGTVDIFVSKKNRSDQSSSRLQLNRDLAKQYHVALKGLAKELKLKVSSQVEVIAKMPEVLKIETSEEVSAKEKKMLIQTFTKACEACDQERLREGKSLQKDLEKMLDLLSVEVKDIQDHREDVNQVLKQKLEQKIQSRLQNIEIDPSRIAQEVVIQLEKSDINEELTRLQEHISNYQSLLKHADVQGKKLDFYTQELLREVNTIGSKSSLSKLTQKVVDAKTYIERLREQVQNVE